MGIRFSCPSGHKLNVKEHLAGKRGICPQCGAKFTIPTPTAAAPAQRPASLLTAGASPTSLATPAPSPSQGFDVASPSVIIAVTESTVLPNPPPVAQTPPAAEIHQEPSQVVVSPQATSAEVAGEAPRNGFLPSIVTQEASAVASPKIRYAAHRNRRRETQFKLALGLLFAVVVLAGVLFWVLLNGPIQPATPATPALPATPSAPAKNETPATPAAVDSTDPEVVSP